MGNERKIVTDEDIRSKHIEYCNVQESQLKAVDTLYTQIVEITGNRPLANIAAGYLARLVILTVLNGEQNVTRETIVQELECDELVAMTVLSTYSVLVPEMMGTRSALMKRRTTRGNRTNHPKKVVKPLDITLTDEDEFLKGVGLF